MTPSTIVLACATVIEEMLPLMPQGMEHRVLEFGLHAYADRLRSTLQASIDELVHAHAGEEVTILLGYGLCSQALVGVEARGGGRNALQRLPAGGRALGRGAGGDDGLDT